MNQDKSERNANSLRQLQRILTPDNNRVYVHTVEVSNNGARQVEIYAPVVYDNPFGSKPDVRIAWLTAHVANVSGRKRTQGGTGAMLIGGGGMAAHDEIAVDLSQILGFEVTAETL